MIRSLVLCLAILVMSIAVSGPAQAEDAPLATAGAVYDTVDAVEVWGDTITVTGIIAGQSAPSTLRYDIFDGSQAASRCDRLALLAMSKPGKFQFATVALDAIGQFGCKLIARAP